MILDSTAAEVFAADISGAAVDNHIVTVLEDWVASGVIPRSILVVIPEAFSAAIIVYNFVSYND